MPDLTKTMAKSKPKKPQLSPMERLLRSKAEVFVRAEREFWKRRYQLEERLGRTADALELELRQTIPDNLASVVWGLIDGVAFVRYETTADKKGSVDFRASPYSLERWGNE